MEHQNKTPVSIKQRVFFFSDSFMFSYSNPGPPSRHCRSKLFCWDQGDSSRGARQHRRADGLLLHLPGRDVVHAPSRHLRAAATAHPAPKQPSGPALRGGGQEENRGSVHPKAGFDTVTSLSSRGRVAKP